MDEAERKAAYWAKKRAREKRRDSKRTNLALERNDEAARMFSIQGLPQLLLAQVLTLGKKRKP